MRRRASMIVALSVFAGLTSSVLADNVVLAPPKHPSQILVRFRPDASADAIAIAKQKAGVLSTLVTYDLVPGLTCLQVQPGLADHAIAILSASEGVMYAEPDYLLTADAQSTPYGITMVKAPDAWTAGGGTGVARGAGVRVAVLDTGVAFGHPDLPTPVLTQSFIAGQTVDDYNSHGTHCAGTILGLDNTEGVIGVAPEASLMCGKVLANSGSGPTSGVLAGVNWAVANGANVISMSLGGGAFDQAFADAVVAANNAGVTVVAAAGNSATATPQYPAAYPGVISVAAVDSSSNLASFSNFGPLISVSAPGVGVQSTVPLISTQVVWSGTARASNALTGGAVGSATGNAVYCGLGDTAAAFPASVAGNIAHIRRGGGVSFGTKATNAIAAGAIGVVISNNVAGNFTGTLNTTVSVPVCTLSQADGDALQAANGVLTTVGTQQTGFGYASFNGTSMACPHVAGVAALLYAAPGNHTPAQIREAMEQTAVDLGTPGRDDTFGWGLVDAAAARAYLLTIPTACNLADIAGIGGTAEAPGAPDSQLTVDDVIVFINLFSDGSGCPLGVGTGSCSRADVTGLGGPPATPDGQLTVDDIIAFFNAFADGCP